MVTLQPVVGHPLAQSVDVGLEIWTRQLHILTCMHFKFVTALILCIKMFHLTTLPI